MARFVETFKDWIVSFPNRYKIIEDGQEKTVEIERDWEPDVEGTSNNERVMNELVKNITYDTDTVHTTESGTSVYICDLVGMKEFTEYSSSDSSFIPKISARINTANSNQLSKIRFSGKDGSVSDYDLYTINNGVYSLLGANKLKPNTIVIIKIVSNGANKIAVVQYLMDDKLDKGTYSGNASNLKAEIDGKVSKSGDTMTGNLTIKGPADSKTVLYNDGFIDLNRNTSPVLKFSNAEGAAYIGRYGEGINAINMGNGVSNCFYRIYDNGVHEALLNLSTAYYHINFSNTDRDGSFILNSSATGIGTNYNGHNGHIIFQNTYYNTIKSISATATDHKSFIFANQKTADFPSVFKFRNSAGVERAIDIIALTCPYSIGDIYITTLSINPATRFLGTTWEKIEGRFLLATSGSNASGQTGGSNTKTISKANLPNVKLQVDSFSLGKGTMEITGKVGSFSGSNSFYSEGALKLVAGGANARSGNEYEKVALELKASDGWTGMSTSASPYTNPLGSGTPLDITPAYYTVHIWKRLS